MKIETEQNHFHNDVTMRTFYRFIPETPSEREILDQMAADMAETDNALKFEGVEPSSTVRGAKGPTFWVPWRGFFRDRR